MVLLALGLGLAAGCANTPAPQTPTSTASAAPAARSPAPAPAAQPSGAQAPRAPVAAHLDPNSTIARERSVYFEFDESIVSRQWMPVVERHGQYLARNPALRIRIEGHTDERGGSEYNLALGQRRAEAVLKALRVYGIADHGVEAISLGEERPKAMEHNEAAWAENRRADIVYLPGP